MADEALVEQARAGDRVALDRLLRGLWPVLQATTRAILRNNVVAAEEAAQIALARVSERLASFDPSRGGFAAWAREIARNAALDEGRAQTRALRREARATDDEDDRPAEERGRSGVVEPSAVADFDAGALVAALGRLPPAHRLVLQLREIEGLSYEAIAPRLGVSPQTVGTWLHRARRVVGRG